MTTDTVGFNIKCRSDLPPEIIAGYGKAVEFMAVWTRLHRPDENDSGMEFDEIMNRFAENVSTMLMGEALGNA